MYKDGTNEYVPNKVYTSEGEVTPAPARPKNAPIPVWDPDTESLRAVDAATAAELQKEGYATGPEAEGVATKNSLAYKAAGFAAVAGKTGSMGLSNMANLALGNKEGLKEVEHYKGNHPIASTVAALTGYGASAWGGPLSVGAKPLLALGGTKLAGSIVANMATRGAGAAAIEGASDEFTKEKLLADPVNIENIAASAMSNVLWNAGANVVGYGIGATPSYLRAKSGNFLDWMEKTGGHKVRYKKIAAAAEEGPRLSRMTISGEHGFQDTLREQEHLRTEDIDDLKDRLQTEQFHSATIKHANSEMEEQATKTATTNKTGTSTSTPGTTRTESAPLPTDIKPEDVDFRFKWDEGTNAGVKKSKLRDMIKFRLKEDPTHMAMWDDSQAAGDRINHLKGWAKENAGKYNIQPAEEEINKLYRLREDYKNYLNEAVPRKVDGDRAIPGFKDLNDEYARAAGNPFKDIETPEFTKEMPKSKVKTPTVRKSEQYSTTENVAYKFKKTVSGSSATTDSEKLKTDSSVRDYHKDVNETRTDQTSKRSGKARFTATFVMPKAAPTMERVGIEQPYSGSTITNTLIAGHLVPGGGTVSKAAAAYMGARNTLAFLANHRIPIGNAVGAVGAFTNRIARPTLQTLANATKERARFERDKSFYEINLKDYEKVADVLNATANNPVAVNSHMQQTYPGFHEQHPEAAAQISTTISLIAKSLNDTVPKRPFQPTINDTPFRPTRAQQVRLMNRWQILANPQLALETGDPQTLQILKEVYPAWYMQNSKQLMHETRAAKKRLMGHAARQITAFTGAAVNPINSQASLKRMFSTAGPAPAQNSGQGQGSGPKMGGGPKSTKTSDAAAHRDDPAFQLD